MKIVVATDGSRGGFAALKFAKRLAARDPGTELIILTVGYPRPSVEDSRQRFERPVVTRRRESGIDGIPVRYRFVPSRSATAIPETIAREADRLKADLVVVGSEGRDTLSEWVVGGVALRLIYVARRPVAVVRPPRRRKKLLAAV